MGERTDELVQEHLRLQAQLMEHIREHGFDYDEYCSPSPGSFYALYRKRWTEITRAITPALHPEENR